jgi:hypothetical protein
MKPRHIIVIMFLLAIILAIILKFTEQSAFSPTESDQQMDYKASFVPEEDSNYFDTAYFDNIYIKELEIEGLDQKINQQVFAMTNTVYDMIVKRMTYNGIELKSRQGYYFKIQLVEDTLFVRTNAVLKVEEE